MQPLCLTHLFNLDLYLLQEGEEFSLRTDEFITPITLVKLRPLLLSDWSHLLWKGKARKTIEKSFRKAAMSFFQKNSSFPCTNYNSKEYFTCLRDSYIKDHSEDGCTDMLYRDYFPNIPFCPKYNWSTEVEELEESPELTTSFQDTSTYLVLGYYGSQWSQRQTRVLLYSLQNLSIPTEVILLPLWVSSVVQVPMNLMQ